MFYLETERLQLIPLTHDVLKLYHADRAAMERHLGLQPSQMDVDPEYAHGVQDALENFWLPKTATHADRYRWYTNWEIVIKEARLSIGGIGFAGYPDETRHAEVGFMLDRQFHGQGYAREALEAMVRWAFADDFVLAVVAQTHLKNTASRKLLAAAEFILVNTGEELVRYQRDKK
jgi:[ribosomal protein S5]-alanine N-acetyltransferase